MNKKFAYKCDSKYEFEFITNHFYKKGYEKDPTWHNYFLNKTNSYFLNKIDCNTVYVVLMPEFNHIGFFMNYNIEHVIIAKNFIRQFKLDKLYDNNI